MRMIFLLLALLVIALLATRQIGSSSGPATVADTGQNQLPQVPTRPQNLNQFSDDMNQFMQDSTARRKQEIDEQAR